MLEIRSCRIVCEDLIEKSKTDEGGSKMLESEMLADDCQSCEACEQYEELCRVDWYAVDECFARMEQDDRHWQEFQGNDDYCEVEDCWDCSGFGWCEEAEAAYEEFERRVFDCCRRCPLAECNQDSCLMPF